MKLIHAGKETTARLDETGRRIQWSDGDVWKRAGLNGTWKETSSGIIHTLSGDSLSTAMKGGTEKRESVELLSPLSFSVTLGDLTYTATLDDLGMSLNWSDGDIWVR